MEPSVATLLKDDLRESLNSLASMVAAIASYYAKLFQFEDLFEDLARMRIHLLRRPLPRRLIRLTVSERRRHE